MHEATHQKTPAPTVQLPAAWRGLSATSSATLADGLRQVVRSGRVSPGDPLPPERLFASELGLARNTVRAALTELEAQGLVCTYGTRIRRVAQEATPASGLPNTVALLDFLPLGDPATLAKYPGWSGYAYAVAMHRMQQLGFSVLSAVIGPGADKALNDLLALRPAGAILPLDCSEFPERRRIADALRQAGIPFVAHCDVAAAPEFGDCVCTDHFEGGRLQAEYLLRRGCRRILRVNRSPDRPLWLCRREAGFDQTLREAGVEPIPVLRTPAIQAEQVLSGRERFELVACTLAGYLAPFLRASPPVDALVGLIDSEAYELAAACRILGYEPGPRLPIIGFDDTWEQCDERAFEVCGPAATVDRLNHEIGRRLADLMVDILRQPVATEPRVEVVCPVLVETPGAKEQADGVVE